MYVCEDCKRHVGPNISEYRAPKGFREDGRGVTGEVRLCPFCALKRAKVNKDDELSIAVRKAYMQDKKQVINRTDLLELGSRTFLSRTREQDH